MRVAIVKGDKGVTTGIPQRYEVILKRGGKSYRRLIDIKGEHDDNRGLDSEQNHLSMRIDTVQTLNWLRAHPL